MRSFSPIPLGSPSGLPLSPLLEYISKATPPAPPMSRCLSLISIFPVAALSLLARGRPTALHMWRAVVARMESQTQETLGEAKNESSPSSSTVIETTAIDPSTVSRNAEEAVSSCGTEDGREDPMKKLRFKKNILLNNLVSHFRQQQEQRGPGLGAGLSPPAGPHADHAKDGQEMEGKEEGHGPPEGEKGEAAADPSLEQEGGVTEDGEVMEDAAVPSLAPKVEQGRPGGSPGERGPSRWDAGHGKVAAGESGSRHVYVGNLPNGVKEEHLREAFKAYGGIESVRLLRRTAQCMTGFLHFKDAAEAIRAKKELDRKPFVAGHLPRQVMKIQYQSRGNNKPCRSIRVHNLPVGVRETDLSELFGAFGRVMIVVINTNSNIAFLSLETVEQAEQAMARWHDQEWRGRHLFLDYALRETISKEDPHLRGERDRQGRQGMAGGGNEREKERDRERGWERERGRERDREWDREREGFRGRERGRSRDRERSRDRKMRDGRGEPPFPSRFDGPGERERDRQRQRDPPPFPDGPPLPPNRLLVLPAARGCPPFEVYAEDLEKLRELVFLMQSHLPPHQRQTLEDALQNRELYEGISTLVGRNQRGMDAVLRDLRLELGLPPDGPRHAPPSPPSPHHQPPPRHGDGPIPSHPRDRGPPPPPFRDPPLERHRDPRDMHERGRPRYPSPPQSDYRRFPPDYPEPHHPHAPHYYPRSPPRGEYRGHSPGRREGRSLPHPPGYLDDRHRGPPLPLRPSSPPPGYGGRERDRYRPRGVDRDPGIERERDPFGSRGMPLMDRRSPSHSHSSQRRPRSRSPPRGMMPPQLPPYPPENGKRPYDRGGSSLGRSRSPSSQRRRVQEPPLSGPPSQPHLPHQPSRDVYPPRGPPPSMMPPGPALPHESTVGSGGPNPPPPLKAECEQFLQTLTGGVSSTGTNASFPSSPPVPSSSTSSRIWLNSSNAAAYGCYEAALNLVKDLLTPHYRAQVIDKDSFKRIAEETTLLLVQQLLQHRLEQQREVPANFKPIAADLVRTALSR